MRRARLWGGRTGGQALVEFALVVPLLLWLIANVVNFGVFFYAWIAVTDASRSGANYMIMGDKSVGAPGPPTAIAVRNLVRADLSSLPKGATATVRVCRRSPSTAAVSCLPPEGIGAEGDFANPPAEDAIARPEAPLWVTAWVDVAYSYEPFIPVFTPIPSRTIHRQAVMRMIQ